jgi:hypothetical protein
MTITFPIPASTLSFQESSYYEAISEVDRASSPSKLPAYPTRPLSPLQTIAEIAETFTTDIGLYPGNNVNPVSSPLFFKFSISDIIFNVSRC